MPYVAKSAGVPRTRSISTRRRRRRPGTARKPTGGLDSLALRLERARAVRRRGRRGRLCRPGGEARPRPCAPERKRQRGGKHRFPREAPSRIAAITGMSRIATMFAILIMGLIAGPAVSLYGSPTVSPVTPAACASEPLPPYRPSSIVFLALSQAPPPDGHRDRQEDAGHDGADEQPAEHLRLDDPDGDRDGDRDQRRHHHLLDRGAVTIEIARE